MHDVIQDINRWMNNGESVILATVVHTWGSSPRRVGAKMAFTTGWENHRVRQRRLCRKPGIESGVDTLRTGKPQLLRFGVADETAFEVGLACGGNIEIFVMPLDRDLFVSLEREITAQQSVAMSFIVEGPEETAGEISAAQ